MRRRGTEDVRDADVALMLPDRNDLLQPSARLSDARD
jgi:hypothetical protein